MVNPTIHSDDTITKEFLLNIESLDNDLKRRFSDRLFTDTALTRPLVSFQANKTRPVYRWYKYKEAFSASLIEFLLHNYHIQGKIFDPFAGSGTSLFAASEAGIDAEGIELLPIGQTVILTKQALDQGFSEDELARLQFWIDHRVWQNQTSYTALPELRITKGAYPEATKIAIEQFLAALQQEKTRVKEVLFFSLLCVLESISYTRKDGQYLRWDYRSGRKSGKKPFNKGHIPSFDCAIAAKLQEILADLLPTTYQQNLFSTAPSPGVIGLVQGSCLDVMPTLKGEQYDAIITSPPYCNRYDYTRTYALELALLGVDEPALVQLRQTMLSCTVENREKNLLEINPLWHVPLATAYNQRLLQEIISYLNYQREQKNLNNSGIPRMVKGYFFEMACVIAECARLLKPGAPFVMINDNVRYAGASISVDLILSDIAQDLGFTVEKILVLPSEKGNSSQQMGEHGRDALRKCVYIWRKH